MLLICTFDYQLLLYIQVALIVKKMQHGPTM